MRLSLASRCLDPLRRLSLIALTALGLAAVGIGSAAQAQTARKPSPYENSRPLRPDEIEARKAEDAKRGGPAFLGLIRTEAEFQQLARVYNPGTPLEIPHVLFHGQGHADRPVQGPATPPAVRHPELATRPAGLHL
ncbi:hypothetical protein G6F68_014520 [Rhizopus microsporus]|nr:hypothetical protein G6F68_014520 [Rhizopus microsporus]